MANKNQSEPNLPISKNEKRSTSDLLPRFYRTDGNKKFLGSTLDQLTQPGTVKKVNGYIGRKNAKAVTSSDIFLQASDKTRQDYQLEPSAVVIDYLGNVNFYKDYIDHINQISVLGGTTKNHQKLNSQEFYSWDPHIEWDKFVNYQNYYWLPYGPAPIEVLGQQQDVVSRYTVSVVDEVDNYAFLFSPDGLTRNPTLTLYRGQTYEFEINSPNNPFTIKTSRVAGDLEKYSDGVSASSVQSGTITFTVGVNTPDVLFYVSETDANTGGVFHILDIDENTYLDVETEILGKKTYTMSNGVALSNGMKLYFSGNITPEVYSTGYWYVEGVGDSIKLISESDLEIISGYSQEQNLLFDDEPFDQNPFSTATAFPRDKDYVLISRGSIDRNQWSRYNRWFHQDVITASAELSGQSLELDQAQRAIRPIIEFKPNLKLFNFGHKAKANVDLIDTFTTDVFSTIEGSLGYNVDGIDLANGMRVLFVADKDRLVNGKIFKVNFIDVINPGRQLEFLALTNIDVENNTIRFETNHGLTTGNQVLYLNNGNLNVNGLINRKAYYVSVIDDVTIKLFNDKNFYVETEIFEIGSGVHKLEVFSGIRRQINLTEEADTTPLEFETVLINQGLINQGLMYWYNGSDWILGQTKTEVNQEPLFDLFNSDELSFSDSTAYDSSTFKGNKIFSYKRGTGTADTELKFPLTYKNINNIGDITFEFNLLNDTFEYKEITLVKSETTDVGYVRKISDLNVFSYENGWKTSLVENYQPVIRIFNGTETTNNFVIDCFDNITDLTDLVVKVYINGLRVDKSKYSIVTTSSKMKVVLATPAATTDVVTLKLYTAQEKNNNGHYELPINFQNNPLNDNLTEFTLGQVIDHVDSIIDNLNDFNGVFPGTGNLRDLGNVTPYGVKFVQHSGSLNLSLYHLGSKTSNVFKALDKAREDYGKFKRAFLVTAASLGIDADTKEHVDFVLKEMSKDKPKTTPYYLSDMFGYTGYDRLEYTVLDSRIKTYPLSDSFTLASLSNKAINVYLNGTQLVHGKDYVFGDDIFFEILTDLTVDDLIEVYEYKSTDGSFCPPTPTKLGLYPKFEPAIYLDTSYQEPTNVILGHDGSITVAFGDFRDDLILDLEKRIFNNIKVEYNKDIFDIFNFITGYNRSTDFSKEETDQILGRFFYQWTATINQDFTKQTGYDRLNPFTFNYRGNYADDGSAVPAYWRGIYKWLFDTDQPHLRPWECLGLSIEPSWWQDVYGPAPYTSDNKILWEDLSKGLLKEPGKPARTLEQFIRPILEKSIPVDEDGNLLDPVYANAVNGYIRPTEGGYYVFGDQAPVETAWRRSSYYPFALIQTALLLKPNMVLGTCLDRSRIVKNLTNQLVYSDTGLRLKLKDLAVPSTALSDTRVQTAGLINYVVEYLTSDTTALIDQYKEELATLTNRIGSKLGGFTSKAKFKILLDSKSPTSSGGVFVPEENYNIFLNTSSPTRKLVYSGVMITKFADGFEVRGYNLDEPFFTYYPWVLTGRTIRIGGISETFVEWTPDRYYVVGKVVSVNNQYFRVKVSHQSGATFDSDLFTRLPELPVIGGREAELRKQWDLNTEITIGYGTKFEKIQEVVDFLQGYGTYLEKQGFVFDEFNTNTKTVNNWETSIKEFLFWTTQNWAEGSVLSLSPAASTLVANLNNEVVDNILDTFYGYKIFRVDGQKLEPDFTNLFRDQGSFSLSVTNSNHGIYGATLYLIQKEHVLLLDNTTLFNDTIYDVEPGYRQDRVKVLGYMSKDWSGGFNIPGFIFDQARIVDWTSWTDYNLGDIVKYKEFYYTASKFLPGAAEFNSDDWIIQTDKPVPTLYSNWDYRAEQFTDFYDLDTDNFDAEQQRLAQHLIGYQKRQYLENIVKDDVSQYKFYQGMIIEKGTQNVFNKLFDVLSADNQESLTFNEEWAVRVGQYGSVDAFNEIEFSLDESQFKINPQPVELTSTIDPNVVDFVYRQRPSDIYIKPVGYNNNPWSVTDTTEFLRTPGYVKYENVKLNVDVLADAANYDISTFVEGDYVWCAFEGRDWNVYRFTKTDFKIEDVEYSNGTLSLTCSALPELRAGDIIGIENSELIKGFHVIDSITLRTINIKKKITNWEPFSDSSEILTYKFNEARVSHIDSLNSILPREIKPNELVWVDDNGQGKWSVYQNLPVYTRNQLASSNITENLNFGKAVSVSKDGKTALVSTNSSVLVYTRGADKDEWIETQTIFSEQDVATIESDEYGTSTAVSEDGVWLAIASPTASYVKTRWEGIYEPTSTYPSGSIVKVGTTHWKPTKDILGDGSTVNRFTQDWESVSLINTDETAVASTYESQGLVEIYQRQITGAYELVESFVSPLPASNEKFGSKMKFAKNDSEYVLAVSSAGFDSNQGRVYMFRYGATVDDSGIAWHMDYNRNYLGMFDAGSYYYPGDIVFYNQDLHRCVSEVQGTFEENTSCWELLYDQNILGYFPHDIVTSEVDADVSYSPTASQSVESVFAGDYFGYDFDLTSNGSTLVISAPGADQTSYNNYKGRFRENIVYSGGQVVYAYGAYRQCAVEETTPGPINYSDWVILSESRITNTGKVFVYSFNGEGYDLVDTLGSQNILIDSQERFGESVDLSDSGSYLAIGSILSDSKKVDQGKVSIFESYSGTYSALQTIYSPKNEINENFGASVFFLDNDEGLAVFSANGDIFRRTTFDDLTTSFDNETLAVIDKAIDAGRIDIFDRYSNTFVYGESLDTDATIYENYGNSIAVSNRTILVGAPRRDDSTVSEDIDVGIVYSYSKPIGEKSWTVLYEKTEKPNLKKIKKAFIYDSITNELISYLDIVDPVQGKIPGPADQEIKYKTFFDPATYSVGTDAVTVDEGMNWTKNQVGSLWWDLTRAKFLENQAGSVVYRSTTWNRLYESASIDLYEWVETKYLPSEWDKLSTTDKGIAQGITGKSKYGDAVYSVKKKYDSVSRTFTNTYYYWVKDKTTIPSVPGRINSASNLASLIADPIAYGYPCLALTGSNSFSLVNLTNLVVGKNTKLNVQYWLIDDQEINAHSQWKVISEHPNTVIPTKIEQKWFDSLVGKDINDRTVPDLNLPIKLRYGVEFRPRQSMFVNRIEAVKQFIERTNSVLAENLIVDDFNLSSLDRFDPEPTLVSGIWDVSIDTEAELRFIGTAQLRQARLTAVVEEGQIVDINIVDSGYGYVNAPYLKIAGAGSSAVIKSVINDQGQIVGVDILEAGTGYRDQDTTISIRPFAVLVKSDSSTFDKWSIYSWDKPTRTWSRTRSQAYDVTKFWQYQDWYATGYNQFTKIDHVVDNTYQLVVLNSQIGNIVQVKNVGTGGWLLLEKYADVASIDYTQSFKVVGRQNGTIQFSNKLYSFKNNVLGFDGPLFDADTYDNSASVELRIILETIRDYILVDNLRTEYLKLFFASARYALHEQTFVDWIFKTSFVKATHNAGNLTQKVTYNNDNLEDFESYVNEVKPYRTKVREYVSSYSKLDNASSSVTDFDLMPIVSSDRVVSTISSEVAEDGSIVTDYAGIDNYPWKHWQDNVGFKVTLIDIVDGGAGYIGTPVVTITGGFGSGASAKAFISNGKVNRIELVSQGSGYLKAPIVTISGGLVDGGTPATAIAVIEESLIRSNKISVKFDRISKNYILTELTDTETFTGTGSRLQWPLKWSPNIKTGSSLVTVDGVEVLRDDYTLATKKSTSKGFVSYSGTLTLATAPAAGATVEITYEKDFNHLSATDRINFYYNSGTGRLGKDLSQLMTGVDYGGVNITGLGFGVSGGWDALPWFSDAWDGFDAAFDDYIVTVGDSSYTFELPYVPAVGEEINVYVNGRRIDDPYFDLYDGVTVQPNGRTIPADGIVMNTIIGDGVLATVTLPNLTSEYPLDINEGDKVIFRKSTSDGSFLPRADEYDSQISGGDLTYSSATGLAPDDINIDGDGFVTPMTSHAPEEVVPGQVVDTVAIKVFHSPTGGAPKILFKNYVASGSDLAFTIGQNFPTARSVMVKVDDQFIEQTAYTIDWQNNQIIFEVAPAEKSIVSIISFSFNAETILDLDYFVSDGSTVEYLTKATWIEDAISSTVLVNGEVIDYELFRTDASYGTANQVGIRFGEPIAEGSVINYIIDLQYGDSSIYETSSIVQSQTIIADGSTLTHQLENLTSAMLPGVNLKPYETNVLVRVDQTFLRPPTVMYYTLENDNLSYSIPLHKFAEYGIDSNNIRLFINGEQLLPGREYVLDLAIMTVEISRIKYVEGAVLAIVADVENDYTITDSGTIELNTSYPEGTEIEVITFYNHSILGLDRTTDKMIPAVTLTADTSDYFAFTNKRGSKFALRKVVESDDRVWILKNGQLLTHSVDYFLDSDKLTVKLSDSLVDSDVIQVLAFTSPSVKDKIGFMQFKDMLNRVHYKRIHTNKSTILLTDLTQSDIEIVVENPNTITNPNRSKNLPGIIEINGERIEFFTKNGNRLGQLRRGTLGTGIPVVHSSGTVVQDIGVTETIPYQDQHVVETFISDGSTKTISLNYTLSSQNEVDVFVGGYRLKKADYSLFLESNGYPYSPEGDSTFEAEFTVNTGTTTLTLRDIVPENVKIVVIKKIGKLWSPFEERLIDSDNQIANFLKSAPVVEDYIP
jgi:hypothetical protein